MRGTLFLLTLSVVEAQVPAFLAQHCQACHNPQKASGSLDVTRLTQSTEFASQWEAIIHRMQAGEMPPKGLPRPDARLTAAITREIQDNLERADAQAPPNPGRITARRLNRAEYNNTIRDLLAVPFRPADDFPPDDAGYGFDNIAAVLSLSPVLMEKYLAAAETATRRAIFGDEPRKPSVVRHQPPYRAGADGGDSSRFLKELEFTITDYDRTGLSLPSALHTRHHFPSTGVYEFRISPDGNRPKPSEPFPVVVWIDGRQSGELTFKASYSATGMEGEDQTIRIAVAAGERWVAISAPDFYDGLPRRYGATNPTAKPDKPAPAARRNHPPLLTDNNFRVNFVEVSGPFEQDRKPAPESHQRVFVCPQQTSACASRILSSFASRAFRRPVTAKELRRLNALHARTRAAGNSFHESVAIALQAVLISPHFLFRIESDSPQVTPYELASRLSYFLWSSTPDAELLARAADGKLAQPTVLAQQVRRMIADPKAQALVENFGGQWLQFRALESAKPDSDRFPRFDHYLRQSMLQETTHFFAHVMREDRPITDFLNANYTFLNENLARFYGIAGVTGPEFRRVEVSGSARGGVFTHAGILTVSSYATRTSPVLRGKWILENLLNTPPPPPPPNVPALNDAAVGTAASLRASMEQHRTNAICASCHSRMDPLGFGLENFDAIGRWRTVDGKFPIDAAGSLPDGRAFDGPKGLRDIMTAERDKFAAGFAEKLLTYALGRGLERFDRPAVKTIAARLREDDYRFSRLVLEIVNSLPFQQHKGDRPQ